MKELKKNQPEEFTTHAKRRKTSSNGIEVLGIDNCLVRISKCCSPVPGDEIVGFVTRGRGMSIHRTDCVNILNLSESERIRLIDAEWETGMAEEIGQYMSSIKLYANNRQGLLMEVSKVFTENKIDINSINTHTSKQGVVTLELSFAISGRDELNHVVEKLRQISGILDIERTTG
jgi:GTP pyrophosphokinase